MKKIILLLCLVIFIPCITHAQIKNYYTHKVVNLDSILSNKSLERDITVLLPRGSRKQIYIMKNKSSKELAITLNSRELDSALSIASRKGYGSTITKVNATAKFYEITDVKGFYFIKVHYTAGVYGINVRNKIDDPFPLWEKEVSLNRFIPKTAFHEEMDFTELFDNLIKFEVVQPDLRRKWVVKKLNNS